MNVEPGCWETRALTTPTRVSPHTRETKAPAEHGPRESAGTCLATTKRNMLPVQFGVVAKHFFWESSYILFFFFSTKGGQSMHPPPGGNKSSEENLLLPNKQPHECDALLVRLTFRLFILAISPFPSCRWANHLSQIMMN